MPIFLVLRVVGSEAVWEWSAILHFLLFFFLSSPICTIFDARTFFMSSSTDADHYHCFSCCNDGLWSVIRMWRSYTVLTKIECVSVNWNWKRVQRSQVYYPSWTDIHAVIQMAKVHNFRAISCNVVIGSVQATHSYTNVRIKVPWTPCADAAIGLTGQSSGGLDVHGLLAKSLKWLVKW